MLKNIAIVLDRWYPSNMTEALIKLADVSDHAAPHDSILIADSPIAFHGMQQELIDWIPQKLAAERAELEDIDKSIEIARKAKWSMVGLRKRRTKALDRVSYYEKVQAALAKGYVLFPPLTNDIVLFAIRVTSEDTKGVREETSNYQRVNSSAITPAADCLGEGKYVSPTVKMVVISQWKDENGNDRKLWEDVDQFSPVQFPLAMCRAHVVESASDAMAKLIFDALGVSVPPGKGRDPVIVGRIYGEKGTYGKRRYCDFLISWRVDTVSI